MQQLTNIQELEMAIDKNGEMVVSKNSKNNVIIMSMEEYRKKILEKDIVEHLLKSEEDIEKGRVKDAEEVFEEWRSKYGY